MRGKYPLRDFIFIFKDKTRTKIYESCLKEKKNISEISTMLGLSYKGVYLHIKEMELCGFIELKKDNKLSGQPVFIHSIPFIKDSFYHKLYKMMYEEVFG